MNKWTWEGTYFLIICLSNQQNLPELDGYSIPPSPSPRTHPKVKHSTNRKEGGVRGVWKPQNRTEIRQKTANRIGFFPEYRNRAYM